MLLTLKRFSVLFERYPSERPTSSASNAMQNSKAATSQLREFAYSFFKMHMGEGVCTFGIIKVPCMHASKQAISHHSVSFSELTNIDFPLQFYTTLALEDVFNMLGWPANSGMQLLHAVLDASEGNDFYFYKHKALSITLPEHFTAKSQGEVIVEAKVT